MDPRGLGAMLSLLSLVGEAKKHRKPVETTEPAEQIIRQGRNERCYCGSGKKYKRCCKQKENKK